MNFGVLLVSLGVLLVNFGVLLVSLGVLLVNWHYKRDLAHLLVNDK
ncbi:hypothetical protein Q8G35_17085 [Peribacillus simplex]|uniref:Uncharacterized protein n=2 Tax=Peribacillus TaxID=2675229 RepID=A0AA90PGP2_9BACI|nr:MULTISPECIES: hypothetical protein [Peribacillus]MDP1420060.1 hypothetical protein [Peribacillus simplex]MDP1451945.1 hypothetical protein [Peribacillus frigoritolerans]